MCFDSNSTQSTLGIPSGASGCCRSSRHPDIMLSHGEDKAATNGLTSMFWTLLVRGDMARIHFPFRYIQLYIFFLFLLFSILFMPFCHSQGLQSFIILNIYLNILSHAYTLLPYDIIHNVNR